MAAVPPMLNTPPERAYEFVTVMLPVPVSEPDDRLKFFAVSAASAVTPAPEMLNVPFPALTILRPPPPSVKPPPNVLVPLGIVIVSWLGLPSPSSVAPSSVTERAAPACERTTPVPPIVPIEPAGLTRVRSSESRNGVKPIQRSSRVAGTVTHAQDRIVSTSNTILLLIDLSTVLLTLFLLMFAAGQALLMYLCWRYVRTGRFPTLHVTLS